MSIIQPFNPTGPSPEPCWTPNQTFGFGFNDLRFPSKTELVFLHLSLPTFTFILKKKYDKLSDVKSQNSIYNILFISKTFCTTILVLLPWATCVLHSLPGSNTGVVQDTSSNRVLRKKGLAGTHPDGKHHQACLHSFSTRKKYTRYLFGVDICAAARSWSH